MSADPRRIDPPECRCTDCITGYSVPADRRDALAALLKHFELANGPVSEIEVESALDAWREAAALADAVYGYCTACRSTEVRLDEATDHLDLTGIGGKSDYPAGHGCEVCS